MAYLWLRFAKVLAVAALFAGTIGAFLPRDLADRRRAVFFLAAPGLGLTWTLGFLLAYTLDVSLLEGWILESIGLSLVAINVVLFAVGKEGRRSPILGAIAVLLLVASVGLMILKP